MRTSFLVRRKPKAIARSLCVLAGIFFAPAAGLSYTMFETPQRLLYMDIYSRNDLVSFKNVIDLDSSNSDDTTTYVGIDYSLGLGAELKDAQAKFFLKLERNGPYDADAPLFVYNTLMTSDGVVEKYRNEELLPQVEEFWLDVPLAGSLRFKSGLYTYDVGSGFSLNGSYENYGFTVYQQWGNLLWRVYYFPPDLVYKNHLGPRIRQEEEQGIRYDHNAANFFAADATFTKDTHVLQPYAGVLVDYTSSEKRDNLFGAPIKKDLLGTAGVFWKERAGRFVFNTEVARNFGKGESLDADFKDVYHTGYLLYHSLEYCMGKIIPSLQFLVCSGNKVSLEAAMNQDTALLSGKNRAFSCYSPLNKNLGDSISCFNSDARPIVAMGSGNGLNYGVPRPRTFAVTEFDNLLMPSAGLEINLTDKLCLEIDSYYMRSFAKGVGMLNGEPIRLPAELGYEVDAIVDYRLNKNVLISFLGGYFIPGHYYKTVRDDTSGSLLSPFVRGDGKADPAYQIELSMELTF